MTESVTPEAMARQWLLGTPSGTLSTLSADDQTAGWPFGSIVPFALTAEGAPLIFTANIAQHTRNIEADPRASLLVQQQGLTDDPQQGWRLTLLGRMVRVEGSDELDARYRERVRHARSYREAHDFGYWQLEVTRVRYIAGFGRIRWLPAEAVRRDPDGSGFAEARARIIEHMNGDHTEALREYCVGSRGYRPERARLIHVDPAGFLVETEQPDRVEHFSFEKEITAEEAREVFVSLLQRARRD